MDKEKVKDTIEQLLQRMNINSSRIDLGYGFGCVKDRDNVSVQIVIAERMAEKKIKYSTLIPNHYPEEIKAFSGIISDNDIRFIAAELQNEGVDICGNCISVMYGRHSGHEGD